MYKKISLTIISFLTATLFLYCGTDKLSAGAISNALAGNAITHSNLWAAWNNQAGLASIENVEAGMYTELPYAISELQYSGFAIAVPSKNFGTFALNVNYFGYSLYNESTFGLAYGKQLSKTISVGIGFNYNQIAISEPNGNAGTVTAELGIQTKILPKLKTAVHLYNPTRASIDSESSDEKLPGIVKFGINYQASEKVNVLSEVEKDFDNDAIFKTGFEYVLHEDIVVRAGIHSNNFEYAFGLGYHFSGFTVDLASRYQQDLGFTPSLSLFYAFK